MKNKNQILSHARETLKAEANSLLSAIDRLGDDFVKATQGLAACNGRIVVTGVGKSAVIATKIVATFNSTGTPAVFMHAADAVHGDLGLLLDNDVLLCLSNSGNSAEIRALLPYIKQRGNCIVAIVGNQESYLAKNADYVISSYVENEVVEGIMAPTNSTTLQLALGDALAVCLMKIKGFTLNDFAKFHPGGSIGKKLTLKVSELLNPQFVPQVEENTPLNKVIFEISSKRMGATAVVKDKKVRGIITDGDIRRMLETQNQIDGLKAKDLMSLSPKTLPSNALAKDALLLLNHRNINQVIVLDEYENYLGMIHLHDLIKEGITV